MWFSPFLRESSRPGVRGETVSVLLFSIEMLALLDAGLNLVEALQTLAEKASNEERRQVPARLLESLNEGEAFSRALEKLPGHFSALYIATVRASERTGDFKDSLSRFIAYQEEFERVRRRVVSASLYPAILLFVGAAVFLFLMLYVVPQFAHVYEDIHTELPFFSALLNVGSAIEGGLSPGLDGGACCRRRVLRYRSGVPPLVDMF
jgi:general secretion pathway protein F